MKKTKTILKFIHGSINNTIYLLGCVFVGIIISLNTLSGEKLLEAISKRNEIVILQQTYIRILIILLIIGIFVEIMKTIFKVPKNKIYPTPNQLKLGKPGIGKKSTYKK